MIDVITVRRPLEPFVGLILAAFFSLAVLCTAAHGADGYILKRAPEETCHSCHKTDQNRTPSDPDWDEAIKTHNSTNLSSTKWSPNGWGITGGKYGEFTCTTCHSSHDSKNIYLIRESIAVPNGTDTWPNGTTSTTVDFRVLSGTPANPGPQTPGMMGDDSVTHSTSTRVCEGCHSQNSYHNYNSASNSNNGHNNGVDCTGCHNHRNAFLGAGGSCKDCHRTGNSAGAPEIQAEFERNSHHISKTWADMTDFDCAVCHAEAQISAGEVSMNASYHNNPTGTVDLVSADARGTVYSIVLANLIGGTQANREAANSALDTFCFTCHDSAGATAVTTGNGFPSGYSATNPFGETTNIRTNLYDQVQKNFGATGSLNALTAFDPTGGDSASDPDTKTNNHHAVLGPRFSAYTGLAFGTSLRSAGLLSATVALYNGTTGVYDNSVLHCNDCHSTGYSGHGSANEYLLQTSAAENPTAEHTGTDVVCLKCHLGGYNTTSHFGNGQDYQHTSDLVGAARYNPASNDGHATGIGCLNCHDGAVGFGGAHGLPDAVYQSGPSGSGGGYQMKRRFLPGSGLRYYDPQGSLAWASRVNFVVGEKVYVTNTNGTTYIYSCTVAGQSNRNSNPATWPTTLNATVTEPSGGPTWQNIGVAPTGTQPQEAAWERSAANSDGTCYTLPTGLAGGSISACSHHSGGTGAPGRQVLRPVDY